MAILGPSKSIMGEPNTQRTYIHSPKTYALSGKIMLGAIVVLFTVVVLILCLHIYARCFLLRRRRQQILRRRRSRLVFVSHLHQTPASAASRGLDLAILHSLPVFNFSTKTHPEPLECAVCLSEFEEGEKGRLLPKCNHSFHTDCIDMWFHSHSTCPLCRSPVKPISGNLPPPTPETQFEVSVSVQGEPNPRSESNSGLCSSCQQAEESGVPSSSSASSSRREESMVSQSSFRKKAFGFVGMGIEVPRRNESFKGLEEEIGFGSPLRSPGGGILALKRILIRERWAPAAGSSSSSAGEIDIERGEEQSQPQQ